tara:strand:- start:454 stop:852 length:399 start_codon:yes stop_codon:yes gene_type:complete
MNKNLIYAVGAFLAYSYIVRKSNKEPKVFVWNRVPFGFNGFILPPFGIVIDDDAKGDLELINHEKVHWEQYKREGLILFVLNYSVEAFKKGYDKNKYEIEARYEESEYCQLNYTECVRKGLANTVFNPNFRK